MKVILDEMLAALSRGERTSAYFINVPMIISIIYLLYTTYTFITWPS